MITSISTKRCRRIFFCGNSLSVYADGNVTNAQYLTQRVYDGIRSLGGSNWAMSSLAVPSRTQTQINASMSTDLLPLIGYGDVVVLWELTNDLHGNNLTGAQAADNVFTFAQAVVATGAKLVVVTMITRDFTADASDLWTRGQTANSLIISNASTYGYTVANPASDALFDQKTDASNATYYNADKLHLTTAGYNIVSDNYIIPAITAII